MLKDRGKDSTVKSKADDLFGFKKKVLRRRILEQKQAISDKIFSHQG